MPPFLHANQWCLGYINDCKFQNNCTFFMTTIIRGIIIDFCRTHLWYPIIFNIFKSNASQHNRLWEVGVMESIDLLKWDHFLYDIYVQWSIAGWFVDEITITTYPNCVHIAMTKEQLWWKDWQPQPWRLSFLGNYIMIKLGLMWCICCIFMLGDCSCLEWESISNTWGDSSGMAVFKCYWQTRAMIT